MPYFGPLTVFSFRVTEAETGVPVSQAQCALSDAPLSFRILEGAGGYTDLNGVCTLEALFPARYYSVYKAGYVTARGSVPGSQINVTLTTTAVKYWVAILAGVGGTVDPSGTYQVAANTKLTITATPDQGYILDYWLVNNVKSGNTNPLGVTIDKDNYSINAVFKEAEVPPPTNGGGNGVTWPVKKLMHPFDNVKLEPGIMTWIEKSRLITKIDTSVLVGGKLAYTINYLSGMLKGITVKIIWNDEVIYESGYPGPIIGVPITGSIDLTGYINSSNTLKVGVSQGPLGFNVVTFDVWLTLGYSEEPVIEPDMPSQWLEEWMKEYWWLAAGGIGLAGIYLLTRKGPIGPLIVTVPYYPRERRKEEEE